MFDLRNNIKIELLLKDKIIELSNYIIDILSKKKVKTIKIFQMLDTFNFIIVAFNVNSTYKILNNNNKLFIDILLKEEIILKFHNNECKDIIFEANNHYTIYLYDLPNMCIYNIKNFKNNYITIPKKLLIDKIFYN